MIMLPREVGLMSDIESVGAKGSVFTLEMIKETSKMVLSVTGRHSPQAIFVTPRNELVMVIMKFDSDHKENAIKALRELIEKYNAQSYFTVFESWVSRLKHEEQIYRQPRRDVNRREALTVMEYRKDRNNDGVMVFFKRNMEEIEFEEEHSLKGGNSLWDAYLEFDGIQEHLSRSVSDMNKSFINAQSHKIVEKYKEEIALADTPEKRTRLLIKLAAEADAVMKNQAQSILEDTEDDKNENL